MQLLQTTTQRFGEANLAKFRGAPDQGERARMLTGSANQREVSALTNERFLARLSNTESQ